MLSGFTLSVDFKIVNEEERPPSHAPWAKSYLRRNFELSGEYVRENSVNVPGDVNVHEATVTQTKKKVKFSLAIFMFRMSL